MKIRAKRRFVPRFVPRSCLRYPPKTACFAVPDVTSSASGLPSVGRMLTLVVTLPWACCVLVQFVAYRRCVPWTAYLIVARPPAHRPCGRTPARRDRVRRGGVARWSWCLLPFCYVLLLLMDTWLDTAALDTVASVGNWLGNLPVGNCQPPLTGALTRWR